MNSEELKAAAERLKRWDAGERPSTIYLDATDPIEAANNDAWDLARAFVKRMNADASDRIERAKPIDEAWLRSIANECERESDGEIAAWFDTSLNQISLSKPPSSDSWNVSVMDTMDGDESASIPSITTRGQLLDLLRAIGVTTKEQT